MVQLVKVMMEVPVVYPVLIILDMLVLVVVELVV
jgi:hypothetical protein